MSPSEVCSRHCLWSPRNVSSQARPVGMNKVEALAVMPPTQTGIQILGTTFERRPKNRARFFFLRCISTCAWAKHKQDSTFSKVFQTRACGGKAQAVSVTSHLSWAPTQKPCLLSVRFNHALNRISRYINFEGVRTVGRQHPGQSRVIFSPTVGHDG